MRLRASLVVVAALFAGLPATSTAMGSGTPVTYSDVVWNVTTYVSGLTGCNELRIDATGDLINSSKLSVYGALNCPAMGGGYGVIGGAYFGTDGSFNMNLMVGNGVALQCVRWFGMSGTCTFSNAAGATLGSAYLSLR